VRKELDREGLLANPSTVEWIKEACAKPDWSDEEIVVAAMVPVAMGQGPGAGSRASMAKVIIGGQSLSLLLTLLLTPVAYSLWDDFVLLWNKWVLRQQPTRETPAAALSAASTGPIVDGAETLSPTAAFQQLVAAEAVDPAQQRALRSSTIVASS
jgi:HAE1 family hydrophobic/amphiphilic exporter-1